MTPAKILVMIHGHHVASVEVDLDDIPQVRDIIADRKTDEPFVSVTVLLPDKHLLKSQDVLLRDQGEMLIFSGCGGVNGGVMTPI